MTEAKQIATLPPLQVTSNEVALSPKTGEPRRSALAVVSLVLSLFAAAGIAVCYGMHWWLAVFPDTYAESARLIAWVEPDPGKWLSLTLEGVLAAAAALAAGSFGVAGFQAWNGWRWSRWAGLVAVGLGIVFAVITSWWALIPAGVMAIAAGLLFTKPMSRQFDEFDRFRAHHLPVYRSPRRIFYGRLPRFR